VLPRWPLIIAAVSLLTACGTAPPPPEPPPPTAVSSVRVQGNSFLSSTGRVLHLRGFNLAGGGPDCGVASVDPQMVRRNWTGANTIRVPLNEQCWLGGASSYRQTVTSMVSSLNANGFYVILSLRSNEQMPDRAHSLAFWTSVATAFSSGGGLLFDLFDAPFPYATTNGDRAWDCWRAGGCVLKSVNTGGSYVAAGMNELIAAVRSTGSHVPVLAAGIYRAESVTEWLAHRPADPLGQLGAAFQAQSYNIYCAVIACYDRLVAPVAASVPLFASAVGPSLSGPPGKSCPSSAVLPDGWSSGTLDWLDDHAAGWAASTFAATGDCWALTADAAGAPTPVWGTEIRDRLAL
jgi:endoglucanase